MCWVRSSSVGNYDAHYMDVAHFQAVLLARRASLEQDAELGEQASATVELDQSRVGRLSRMGAMQGQAISQEAQRQRELKLRQIATALQRIDAGDYGYCTDCDEPIAEARLEVEPSAPRCIACAGKLT